MKASQSILAYYDVRPLGANAIRLLKWRFTMKLPPGLIFFIFKK